MSSNAPDASPAPAVVRADHGPVALITLNRPKVRNAIDDALRGVLNGMLDGIARDPAIRAVVLTGAGSAFCAGGDIRAMQERAAAPADQIAFNGWSRQQRTHHTIALLHELPKPVIAAVNGAATGLGADVAICCDFVMAADSASFAWNYVLRGLIPDGGGMYFLPRRVGLPVAKDLIYSGRTVDAATALQLGICDRVVEGAALVDAAIAWATELSAGSAVSLALAKSILDKTFETAAQDVFAQGSQAQAICYTSAAHRASIAAFLARSADKTDKAGKPGKSDADSRSGQA